MKTLFPWVFMLLGYSLLYAGNPILALIPFVLALCLFVEQIKERFF